MGKHSTICLCSACEAKAQARAAAKMAGLPLVLPATKHTSSWGKLGKRAKRMGRIRALSSNSHNELSSELRMLWDTIPNRVRDSVVVCRERHVTSDVLTYCGRKPVVDYRETLLCSFQAAVYQLWQSTHNEGAGFFSYPELGRIYAPTLPLDDSADFDKPVRRGKRVSRRKLQYSLPEYSYPTTATVVASGRDRVVKDNIRPRPSIQRVFDIPKSALVQERWGGKYEMPQPKALPECWHGQTLADGMYRSVCPWCESRS